MPLVTANESRARLELIARRLSQGLTDSEIQAELGIKQAAYYVYKAKIFKTYGDLAKKKTEQSLEFEAELLKDRLTRLSRLLETRMNERSNDSLSDLANAAAVAAQINTTIFKLEFEGLKARQARTQIPLEANKAIRYIGALPAELSESDTTVADSRGEQDTDSTGETTNQVF